MNADDLIMVARVCPVKIKRRKFTDEMVWCTPDLNMRVVRDCDVPDGLPIILEY